MRIRTPLNGVMGMLQLLETTDLTREQREYAGTALQSSQRLTVLLSDILDISRLEAGKMVASEDEFELTSFRDSIVDVFVSEALKKGIDFTFSIDPQMPLKVYFRRDKAPADTVQSCGECNKIYGQGICPH